MTGAVRHAVPTFDLDPSSGRFAGRAMGCSCLLHVAVLAVIFGIPWRMFFHFPRPVQEIAREDEPLLLPPLGSGGGGGSPPGGAGSPGPGKAGAAGRGAGKRAAPVIFRGPQPIVSNPPHPDNFLQTIRQPDLPKPPKLKRPIPAPNIVMVVPRTPPAETKAQQAASKAVRTGVPIVIPPPVPGSTQPPKLALPPSGDMAFNIPGGLPAEQAAVPKPPVPPPPSVGPEGHDLRNLLVLNAMPQNVPAVVPPGELSGSFTVSPNPTAEVNPKASPEQVEGGSANGSSAGGSGAGAGGGTGSGTGGSGTGTGGGGTGLGGNGSGSGAGSGTGPGSGGGPGGTGRGPGGGQGTGSGSGQGSGTGPGRGSGSGGGSGSGSGPGVDIGGPGVSGGGEPVAGVGGATGSPQITPPSSRPRLGHQSFSMTIVASSSSGGGLRDFGVFRNQLVYTVYLDVNDATHRRPRWTMQYAEQEGSTDLGSTKAALLPPYPLHKEFPSLPGVRPRDLGRMMVVSGVVNKEGQLGKLKVLQTPNSLFIEPLLEALGKWTFQAAELSGEPLEVKVLLGIPISADMVAAPAQEPPR